MIHTAHRLVDAADIEPGDTVRTDDGIVVIEQFSKVADGIELAGRVAGRKAKVRLRVSRADVLVVVADEATLDSIESAILGAVKADSAVTATSAGVAVTLDSGHWEVPVRGASPSLPPLPKAMKSERRSKARAASSDATRAAADA